MKPKDENYEFCLNAIKENTLFNKLDEADLENLLACFKLETWSKNTEFFYSDETFKNFHVIITGRLKMFQINEINGREFTLFVLTRNDVFDIISLLDEEKHSMNFETLDEVKILIANSNMMRDWIQNHPKINSTLLPYLAKRMRLLEANLTDNVLSDIPTRLAKLLLKNIDGSSQNLELISNLSHKEIANILGTTRAVVNRHIQNFKKAGLIDVNRKNTNITNVKLLLNRVQKKH